MAKLVKLLSFHFGISVFGLVGAVSGRLDAIAMYSSVVDAAAPMYSVAGSIWQMEAAVGRCDESPPPFAISTLPPCVSFNAYLSRSERGMHACGRVLREV